MSIENEKKYKIRTDLKIKIIFASVCLSIVIIGNIIVNTDLFFKPEEYNEKATVEYLKNFSKEDIIKIAILTEGKYSRFHGVCTFEIKGEKIIQEFQDIVSRQSTVIKKKAMGQTGRETHITLYNNKNERYSFIINSEPYSGKRLIDEVEVSFFKNPLFDVSDNWFIEPRNAIRKNIDKYGTMSSNLQNYELYYFLKKYIIDYTEEKQSNSKDIVGVCHIKETF